MNRMHSLFAVALTSLALSSVACAAPQGAGSDENTGAVAQASTRDLTAPTPEPVVLRCITSLGSHDDVTKTQCESLLKIAGCPKAGAVVGGEQKCSTAD